MAGTTSDLSDLFNKIYEQALFVAREQNLMTQLVTNYNGQGLAQRKLGIYPEVSAAEVAEGVDYSGGVGWSKSTQMTLTPKVVKAQTIVTQSQIATDPDNTMMDAGEELGMAVSTKIDKDLLTLFGGFSSDKGTAGSALTIARCAAGLAVIQNNNFRMPWYFVLHPFGWYDIWTELGQPATEKAFLGETANDALRQYAVGEFMGAQWFVSSNIAIDSDDDAVSAVFTREALAFDVRKTAELMTDEDPSIGGRGWELDMEAWYAVGERRDGAGVALTHDATEPTGV